MAERFEDLRAWQTARSLTNQVYALSGKEKFENDWALKDQIRRAAISIMSNIAEGFESRTRSLFVDFLGRAKASAGEVRAQLVIARDQEYLEEGEFEKVHDRADKVSRQLHNLIQYLERSNNPDDVREVPQEYVTD
ncbi:four helix bundle protein [Salinibacter ruber]|uniref:four helix bundle protein n=1 Tax=Salinibacter ruber TaxID=146919 RepID=UPI002167764A|nr:four helix bundle protein [Salinibacter ruber]MCS4198128.1 four helix bundle protein [Salinibacter ruber]